MTGPWPRDDGSCPSAAYPVTASPEALQALEADVIVLGPGSLYTQVLPALTVDGIGQHIRDSKAKKVFVCNLMTEPEIAGGYSAAEHLRILRDLTAIQADYLLANTKLPSQRVLDKYSKYGSYPVKTSSDEASSQPTSVRFEDTAQEMVLVEGAILVQKDLLSETQERITLVRDGQEVQRDILVIRHDACKLANALVEILTPSTHC